MRFALRLYERFRMLIHEAAKFGVVGLAGFVVALGGADLLHYSAGMGKYSSVIIANVIATMVTFVGNRYWAFRHRERTGMGRETVLFFVLNGIGILILLGSVAIVQDGAGLQGKLWYNVANLCGIALGTLFRFWSYRKWVWRTQEPAGGVPATAHGPLAPAPGSPEVAVAEAVAVGLDEEATLYGRGAESYDDDDAGSYSGGSGSYGDPAQYGAPGNYGGPENYGRGTGDSGSDSGSGGDGNGNGSRPGRHAARN